MVAGAQETVHSSFYPGNLYDTALVTLAGSDRIAIPFTVPPDCDYQAACVELAGWAPLSSTTLDLSLYSDSSGLPGTLIATITTLPLPTASGIITGSWFCALAWGTLTQNTPYWVVVSATNGVDTAHLHLNNSGVGGVAEKSIGFGPWNPLAGATPVLRVKGLTQCDDQIKAAYASYTAPSSGGPAVLYLEVVCPGPTPQFTMKLEVDIPSGQTPAQICQILADAINACTDCDCWGPSCPATSPYDFSADCAGSTLRVRNTGTVDCLFPFVCIDKADFVVPTEGIAALEGVGGNLRLELQGTATGVPLDPTSSNRFTVTRTVRCATGPVLGPITATVNLSAGMTPRQVTTAVAASLAAQGDSAFTVAGNEIVFGGRCLTGADYDIAFQSNDTGLQFAFSPPFAFSMFSYVANLWGAAATNYGDGCYNRSKAFYEFFSPAASFDLNGVGIQLVRNGDQFTALPAGTFVAPSGGATSLSLSDDDEITVPLSSSFPYPGGVTSSLVVCSNGFVSVATGNGTGHRPTASTWLNSQQPRWGSWHDHNPAAAGSGQVKFEEIGSIAYVTWDGVFDFGTSNPNTWQLQFDATTGNVTYAWQTMSGTGNEVLVGYAHTAPNDDLGSFDISTALPGTFGTSAQNMQALALSSNLPQLGTTLALTTTNYPAASVLGIQILSFTMHDPGIELTGLGMPGCFQYVGMDVTTVVSSSGGQSVYSLPIPNTSATIGASIKSQTVALSPGANTLGAITSNGVCTVIGA